jgi:protein-S-isoprenylcysteine O-methyltransferase Ste14
MDASRVFAAFRAAVYASSFVLLWGWLAILVTTFDVRLGGPLPPWLKPLGAALAVAGAPLAIWCVAVFVTAGHGTPAPFDAPRRFVAVGPYRWVRNPMYLGGFAFLGGAALWVRSPAMLLLAAAGLVLAHLFVLVYEEPALAREFGMPYQEYRQRVHRWVPRRPGNSSDPGGAATP